MTRNGRSIILTALLALILVYLFSIIGYLFFRDDFLLEVDSNQPAAAMVGSTLKPEDLKEPFLMPTPDVHNYSFAANHSRLNNQTDTRNLTSDKYCSKLDCPDGNSSSKQSVLMSMVGEIPTEASPTLDSDDDDESKERACDSLLMCIITTLNHGLRNGDGIGDVLRSPSSGESLFVARVIYDLLFFFIVIIIILNLIFGVIIDTFADLRSEKQQKGEILKNTCFICGK